jgi:subtilisin family serine protease
VSIRIRTHIRSNLVACVVAAIFALPPAMAAGEERGAPPEASREAAVDEVIVGFESGATAEQRARAAERVSAEDREKVVRGGGDAPVDLLELERGASEGRAIATLEEDSAVAYAEPNWILEKLETSNDPYFTNGSLWGMYGDKAPTSYVGPSNQYGSQAAEAWADGYVGSSSVVVGVIDEGIMHTHPDLDANLWTNLGDPVDGVDDDGNGYTDDIHGWDFHHNDNTIYDGNPPTDYTTDEHGTHVTGTVGAEGGNAAGVAGVNWNVRYVSGKFLGPNGGTTANAVKAVDYMTDLKTRTLGDTDPDNDVNIVATNNSWGGGGYSQALHDAIIRGANADILFLAAAGNSSRNNDRKANYPSNYNTMTATSTEEAATYDAVIAVAAINKTGGKPSWSNYGKKTVDLGAPGAAINSTVPPDSSGTAYWSFSGTSMATPHVTGAAALYMSRYSSATAAQIRSAILSTTVPTSSLASRTVTGGRLNVSAALSQAPAP